MSSIILKNDPLIFKMFKCSFEVHQESCMLYPIKCQNGCGAEIPKQEVRQSMSEPTGYFLPF